MADSRYNTAWRMADEWKQRIHQQRTGQGVSGLKLFGAWLLFGTLLMVGTVFALFFLLIGWALMPLMRYKLRKRAERFSQTYQGQTQANDSGTRQQHVLEGEYEIKPGTQR